MTTPKNLASGASTMIGLSRFRLAALACLALASVAASFAVTSCGYACTAIGCWNGLVIELGGNIGQHDDLDIEVAHITPTPEVIQAMTCKFTRSSTGEQLLCGSIREHREINSRTINFLSDELKNIRITISSGASVISEQMFEVQYKSAEINGPGCGVCTNATVNVAIP